MKKSLSISVAIITLALSATAVAKAKSSISKSEAKKQCLAQDSSLAGKKLQKCIKNLRSKK